MNNEHSIFNIVIAVCHPDDEVIWVGGLIRELSRLPQYKVHVICLSGNSSENPRVPEFEAARKVAGYQSGVIMGSALRPALTPLQPNGTTLEQGLSQLEIPIAEVSLLITHAPYGDEQCHPHHRQAFRELHSWSDSHHVPFGYFSSTPMPFFNLQSLLDKPKMNGSFQILNFSRCLPNHSVVRRTLDPVFRKYLKTPKYYLQFLTNLSEKNRMLDCYPSIDIATHRKNYAASTSPVEAIYLMDDLALLPFSDLLEQMSLPGAPSLFEFAALSKRLPAIFKKIKRKLFMERN